MTNAIDFKAVIQQMKEAGVRFVTDKSELDISEAYAVLGSKSAIRYLEGESDGINGFVILCAEDEVDMNRLCTVLNRAYYDTEDDKRPFKVQFDIEELQKVINILKMNSLNVASVERTVSRPRSSETGEKHTRARASKGNTEIRGPIKWIVSANAGFDTVRAFKKLKTLDWKQYIKKR